LAKRDPYPNPENISAAKDEAKRVQGFLVDVENHFQAPPFPTNLNSMEFRTYLDNTRARLLTDAQRAGVEVPTNYWFTFAAQKGSMTFSANTLQPLAAQLADISTLCGVLFDAKVNSLVSIKRVPVDSQDSLGSQDYINAKGATNAWSVTMPYEVSFQGFSSGLAAVLQNLARLPQCLIVTNIVVEPAASASSTEEQPSYDPMSRYRMPAPGTSAQELLMQRYGNRGMNRYGGGGRPMPTMPVQPQVVRPVQRGPATILDEKPLRVTLSVQAVRLKPSTSK